jgi:hypothetical protein
MLWLGKIIVEMLRSKAEGRKEWRGLWDVKLIVA